MRKLGLTLIFGVLAAASQAYIVVDKAPNTGGWVPLGLNGNTPIYANSFLFSGATGDVATKLGGYVQWSGGNVAQTFQFLLLADTGGNAPSSTILASSAFTSSSDTQNLVLVTENVTSSSLVNGNRYWVALSCVGGSGDGSYGLGGHTQNSVYNDNGTFWYSNAGDLNNWDGQNNTPEISIYVEAAPVPEPATMAVLGMGALAMMRRRFKK